ncbi:DUF4430 domain-containing protein [Siminovitchia sp. FSL H7-0308]|uniref:DUF4430 domain-containing protein n=1 Tax=Siminovitchia sp. FSL H7-0308 TaxID=2921432 RepID=UPI0030EF5B60
MNTLKKRCSLLFILFILLMPFMTSAASANSVVDGINTIESTEVTITTSLEDRVTTKADKLTFDLWAKDSDGNKIEASHVKVTNNGNPVAVNWDDSEKTSYTLQLEVGENKVEIVVDYNGKTYSAQYTLIREEAEDGDVIGSFTFSLEAFTIGLGYVIEPVQVDITKGRRASHELDALIKKYGYDYDHTGTLENSFYLSYLLDGTNNIYKSPPAIPQVLKEALNGHYDEENYHDGALGEFNFNSLSGWMYSVNNIFPNVGFADYYLSDGDVMRVQYTIALGRDIGGGWDYNFFELVNKDALTKKIAEINSSSEKEEYLSVKELKEAYDHALNVLQTVDATQANIDEALRQIELAEEELTAQKAA